MNEPLIPITLRVDVASRADVSAEHVDEAVRELQEELRELHLDSIEPVAGTAPPGTKAGEVFTWGSFFIALAPELVKQVLTIMIDWLRRDSSRTIKIRNRRGGPDYEIKGAWKAADLAAIMKVLAKQEGGGGNVS